MKARWRICTLPLAATYLSLLSIAAAFGVPSKHQHQPELDRRGAISSFICTAAAPLITTFSPSPAFSEDDTAATTIQKTAFEKRNRNSNKNAIIREDFWYMFNRVPPRRLDPNVLPKDDPKWNAWGTCAPGSDNTSNSCTYVPLKLRSAGYSKYAFLISLASREYVALGKMFEETDKVAWDEAASLVDQGGPGRVPSAIFDAVRKMLLLATALLTSPNYSGPNIDLFVARYYVNEVAYAATEVQNAIEAHDVARARDAWEYGRDSWNSYYVVVNRAIVPKVGEQFESIA